ncbi:DUF2157 domain-containing protein [Paenibacillus xerothermodurans]|uniref:DUF2157 domain-containing protein n=1 Tax=Paenibacillus xerothermodurans TaxID=1977292 RepID=A0A2W1NP10_PAEXE|nr:DUF2157 domain-containing protein [Paenibacillus xerothermodurans]PZE19486.1 DUF2157 domain-containing protein [Paenibacillus xerothermodurans]
MSRKWVEKEGLHWVERGIISSEQYNQILSLYEDKKHAFGMLPLMGSILVGLGVLSFVAANWQDIHELFRLGMIVALMVALYAGGELFSRHGSQRLGIALMALGLISFGGGIVLVGQMFHLIAYDIASFIVWGTVGTLLTYFYRRRFLYLISILIFTGAQWYSVNGMHHFSAVAFGVMLTGLGVYLWKHQDVLLAWCFSVSCIIQAIMLTVSQDWKFLWWFVSAMALYALGDWWKNRGTGYALQAVPLIGAFIFNIAAVIFYDVTREGDFRHILPEPSYFLLAMTVLFGISVAGKIKRKRGITAFEWILAVPFAFLPAGADVLYLLTLFFFSLYVLWTGYAEEWRCKINFGMVLFIVASMVAYGKLTWAFMNKSLFFIIGGLLLFALSWFLGRKKKQFFDQAEGGRRHD